MAFSISVSYDGVNKRDWYSNLFNDIEVLPHYQIVPGNKFQAKIPKLVISEPLKADSCTYASSGTTTITEKTIAVCDIAINQTLCIDDLEGTFVSEYMKSGAMNSDIPNLEWDFINQNMTDVVRGDLGAIMWLGDTTSGTYPLYLCDGLRKKLVNTSYSSSTVNLTASTVTSANAIAEVGKLLANAPAVMKQGKNRDKLFIQASPGVVTAYEQAIATQNSSFVQDRPALNYLGIPVIMAPDMASSEMLLTLDGNFVFSTDLMNDWETLSLIDMRKTTGDNAYRMLGRMKFGVEVYNPQYVVFYK